MATKVRRFQGRVDSYRQNRQFDNIQRQFYRELDQEVERCDDDQSVAEESKEFWRNIWSQSADHKRDANWKLTGPDLVQGFWLKNFFVVCMKG